MNKVEKYLTDNWKNCVRENREDKGNLLGLPYKYTVPAIGHFEEIYYWDTYFTNVGLLKFDCAELAKNNVDDMLYMVDKYGFMPNGSRSFYLTRSQPPFLSEMVRDVYEYYRDRVWLIGAYETLKKEYKFWSEKRTLPIGLNHYDSEYPNKEKHVEGFIKRVGYRPDLTDDEIAHHSLATCESGWDMNPRWDFEAYNFAAVDLNCLLYRMETNMSYFADILGKTDETALWKERSGERYALMLKYLLDENKIFMDYNYLTDAHSSVFSVASYFPLYVKMATAEQAAVLVENLSRLEEEYGVSTCEKQESSIDYQWGYPNGWACLQHIMIVGLDNYGYKEEAKRIAKKYIDLADKVFDETGNLWEKYNVVEGNINVSKEYVMPPMFGWSAGVYVFCKEYLSK